jgi:hypothetical protein
VESKEDGEHIAAKAGGVLKSRVMGCQQQLVNPVLRENIKWKEEAKKLTDYELGTSNLYHSFWIKK